MNKYQLKGKDHVFEINAYPTETGLSVFVKDITERKKAEDERRETTERVQRVVGGLTRHDVRNKLTAVTGNAYLARKKLPGNSEVLDYLKQVEVSVEQAVRILEFARAYEMLSVEELAYVDVEKWSMRRAPDQSFLRREEEWPSECGLRG